MSKLIGQKLRALRMEAGLSQEDVAGRLGFSRQKYIRIESGSSDIGLDTLSKCAALFQIPVGEITGVLDDGVPAAYRKTDPIQSANEIKEMIGMFYANKRAYERSRSREDAED